MRGDSASDVQIEPVQVHEDVRAAHEGGEAGHVDGDEWVNFSHWQGDPDEQTLELCGPLRARQDIREVLAIAISCVPRIVRAQRGAELRPTRDALARGIRVEAGATMTRGAPPSGGLVR